MNPLIDPEDIDEATRLINQYAASDWCSVSFSTHAQLRMQQRLIPLDVVTATLQVGTVVAFRSEIKANRRVFKYEVEMVDRFGRVTVITAVPGRFKLHVVSTFTDIPD